MFFVEICFCLNDDLQMLVGKKHHLFFIIFYLTLVRGMDAIAQTDSLVVFNREQNKSNFFSAGAGLQHGFIFAHSQDVQNTKGANPTGIEAYFSWQRIDTAIWKLCNCFPRRGLLVAYYDYDNSILGKSATAAYFLEPSYRLGKKTFFSFTGAAGVSYLSNPFDSIKNFANRSYSTHISVYLRVGVGLWQRLANLWWLNASVNYQHESNGGLRQPNKGINWPTAGIIISYQKDQPDYISGKRSKEKFRSINHPRWDAALFGTARRTLNLRGESIRLPLFGFP
jgi:hypothetical protein